MSVARLVILCCILFSFVSQSPAEDVVTVIGEGYSGKEMTFSIGRDWSLTIAMSLDRDLIAHDDKDASKTAADLAKIMSGVEAGDADAQYSLGILHLNGTSGIAKSNARAFELLRSAAERRCLPACNALGVMYVRGQGITQNTREGVKWLRLAGSSISRFNLSYLQFWRLPELEMNPEPFLLEAARDEKGVAEFYLGLYYLSVPIQKDSKKFEKAYEWLLRAAGRNYDTTYAGDAKKVRDLLRDKLLSSQQVAAIQDRAGRSYRKDQPVPPVTVVGPSVKQ